MAAEEVLVASDRGVCTITLHRPAAKNALSITLLGALERELAAALGDESVAVIIITGGDGCFSAGADVRELAVLDAEGAHQVLARGGALFRRIERAPKPVLASIDGIAAGGGLELALSCTMSFASTNARLGLPEVSLGLIPGLGGTQRLTRAIGRHRATRLMLTGVLVSADEAWDLGLLSAPPVAPAALTGVVHEMCDAIASKSASAIRAVLEAVDAGAATGLEAGLGVETGLAAVAVASADGREGMAAFAQKRAPRFGTEVIGSGA